MAIPSLLNGTTISALDANTSKGLPTVPKRQTNFKTATLVDDDTPLTKVVRYIEGESWTVEYYNQIIGENDSTGVLDINLDDTMQQYTRINEMELKVNTPLDISQPDSATGSAIVYNGIIPQTGDMFKAVLAGNRATLLTVTEVDQLHYNNNNIYTINYKIDTFLDIDEIRYDNLLTKVVREYFFDSSYVLTESAPILLETEFVFKKKIEKLLSYLSDYYFKENMDKRLKTLVIPVSGMKVSDPYIESFMFKIINFTSSELLSHLNRVSDSITLQLHNTIWQVLLDKNISFLYNVKKELKMITKHGIFINPILNSVLLSDVQHPLRLTKVPDNLLPTYQTGDYTYLFTSKFYEGEVDPGLSVIENLVLDFLNNRELDRVKLDQLASTYMYWNNVEKFYYIPVMMILLKHYISRSYSII